jgi:hypothetical protein
MLATRPTLAMERCRPVAIGHHSGRSNGRHLYSVRPVAPHGEVNENGPGGQDPAAPHRAEKAEKEPRGQQLPAGAELQARGRFHLRPPSPPLLPNCTILRAGHTAEAFCTRSGS